MARIGFLATGGTLRSLSEPERHAWGWLADRAGTTCRIVPFEEAGTEPFDLFWWHGASDTEPTLVRHKGLQRAVEEGTPLLLTGLGMRLLPVLGLETRPPAYTLGTPYEGEESEHEIRGHMTFAGHPAFAAFGRGTYTWKARRGHPCWDAWYDRDTDRPRGRRIAVERTYIAFDPERITALTHDLGRGTVASVGSHLPFDDRRNPYRGHMIQLLDGYIRWLTRPADRDRDHSFVYAGLAPEQRERSWPVPGPGIVQDGVDPVWGEVFPGPPGALPAEALAQVWEAPPPGGLERVVADPPDAFFDVTGRRHFMTGHARSGLAEAWTGGIRLFRECRLLWETGKGDAFPLDARGSEDLAGAVISAETRPDVFRRTIRARAAAVGETLSGLQVRQLFAAHPEAPGGITLLEVVAPEAGTVRFDLTCDLRLMWPFPAGLLGPLAVCRPVDGVIALRGQDGDSAGALSLQGAAGPGSWSAEQDPGADPSGADETSAARLEGRIPVPAGTTSILLAWSAGSSGLRPVARALGRLVEQGPDVAAYARLKAGRDLGSFTRLRTPGRPEGEQTAWLAGRLLPFEITADGVGSSLVAGYDVCGNGWLSGRPGYAWFFGRDAVFTALGALAAGRHEAAHDVLTFLAAHQEWTGKILHEASLSGAVHYDAADSTPLWLVLLGAWYRASGDLDGLRALWPTARAALRFCRSTDTDRDGLIENTGAGHGWIEGGKLYGAHVTGYLAGVWGAALDAAASCAEALGEPAEARGIRHEAALVRRTLEDTFWLPEGEAGGHYGLGMRRDRSLQEDFTVMPAVSIGLGQTDPDRGRTHLVPLAGSSFSADWGVRMVGRDHPHFDPEGYHYGSIWPLFTGWTARAEYAVHRHEAGLAHVRATLATLDAMSTGHVEEVLHGLTYRHAGVCAHQAWSHAATLQAIHEGLVGWQPDARAGQRSRLAPHIPESWEAFACEGLRVADDRITLEVDGAPGRRRWILRLAEGALPRSIRFAPALPAEARIQSVTVGPEQVHPVTTRTGDDLHLELDLDLVRGADMVVDVVFSFDLVPVLEPPVLTEGAGSSGVRLVDRWWEGASNDGQGPPSACRLFLEGPAGSTREIPCLMPGRRPTAIQGAAWVEPPRKGTGRMRIRFPEGEGFQTVGVVVTFS